jgi:hypothetical protein
VKALADKFPGKDKAVAEILESLSDKFPTVYGTTSSEPPAKRPLVDPLVMELARLEPATSWV